MRFGGINTKKLTGVIALDIIYTYTEMIVLKSKIVPAVGHSDASFSESKTCKVRLVVCFNHCRPDKFAQRLDFKGEEGILLTS